MRFETKSPLLRTAGEGIVHPRMLCARTRIYLVLSRTTLKIIPHTVAATANTPISSV
jgi:hypothetical protein